MGLNQDHYRTIALDAALKNRRIQQGSILEARPSISAEMGSLHGAGGPVISMHRRSASQYACTPCQPVPR